MTNFSRNIPLFLVAATVAVVVVACGGKAGASSAASPTPKTDVGQGPTSPPSPGAPLPTPTDAPSFAATEVPPTRAPEPASTASVGVTVNADEANDGQTVTLKVGDSLHLVLNNTYWQISDLSASDVLTLTEGPITTPVLTNCVPGSGCGTVSATYAALAPGEVSIEATRTTCGEALKCTSDQSSYVVTVKVVAP
jgi:hypothetical protein